MTQTKSHLRLRALCEGAIFIALAQVLSYLKLYSALYNGSFMLIDMVLVLVIGALLWKPLKKYITGEDLHGAANAKNEG